MPDCDIEALFCECDKEKKVLVPLAEREYLKDQRQKTTLRGSFQLGSIDRAAVRSEKRRQESQQKEASAGGSESPPQDPESSLSEDPGQSSSDDTYEAPPSRASYNLTKTPRFAMELVRSGTSTRAGPVLATLSFWT